jgi:hypothetical protein
MIIPLKPKRSIPILAARGTPSSTDPTAQAMLKRIKKLPAIRPDHKSQFKVVFLEIKYKE